MSRTTTTRGRTRSTTGGVVTAAAVAATALVAGCASLPGSGTAPGGPGQADDASLPVLEVTQRGGFVPVGWDFQRVNDLTVYADGLAVTQGPQILIYPGPALPNLVATELDDADVAAIRAAAQEAGLLGETPDYGASLVADVPQTVVTLRFDGQEHVHVVEALGIADGTDGSGIEPGIVPEGEEVVESREDLDLVAEGVEPEHTEARQALLAFLDEARTIATSGADEQYVLGDFSVTAMPVDRASDQAEEGLERQVLPWPVDSVTLADGACVDVRGDDAAALEQALAGANQLTLWEQDGEQFEVFVRPLLPHESGCVDLD